MHVSKREQGGGKDGEQEGKPEGEQDGEQEGKQEGEQEGEQEGKQEGEPEREPAAHSIQRALSFTGKPHAYQWEQNGCKAPTRSEPRSGAPEREQRSHKRHAAQQSRAERTRTRTQTCIVYFQ